MKHLEKHATIERLLYIVACLHTDDTVRIVNGFI